MSVDDMAMTSSASSPLQAMPLEATRNSGGNVEIETGIEEHGE